MRILIVDDDVLDRAAIRRCLLQSGVAVFVDEAATAADAVARIRPGAFDCVILDYYMPGVDNVSLLREVHGIASDMPVIILTGRGDEEIAVDFMKAGALDYLPKASLTPVRLAASCRHAVEMARASAAQRDVAHRLQEREAEFRALANAIPQMAWIADSSGRRYWYNDRWYEFTGLSTRSEPRPGMAAGPSSRLPQQSGRAQRCRSRFRASARRLDRESI